MFYFAVYGTGKEKRYLCRIKGQYDWGDYSQGPLEFSSAKKAIEYGTSAPTTKEEMKSLIKAEPE